MDDPEFELQQGLTGSTAHPASYSIGPESSFQEIKQLRHEADHSPPSTAEAKNERSYSSTPRISHHGVGRDSSLPFTFL